ncbi:MAG TPA: hypothetical protein VF669_22140 [Tepidisphaeraceae bacterium]|jgi:hypothetical protein
MLRRFLKTLFALILVAGGGAALVLYQQHNSAAQQIARLEEQKQQLQTFVQRLSAEKRVADVIVSKVETLDNVLHTTLLFVEYDRTGQPLPAKTLIVQGGMIHFDAMVIKFDRDFVQRNDPLRGHSIALFTKVYGDHQTPEAATPIDDPGVVPQIYRNADERLTNFETSLWKDFWRLASDEAFRAGFGVRVANGQGVWGPLEPNRLYTLTLESSGGLNLNSEPMRGIYREALKQPPSPATATPASGRIE